MSYALSCRLVSLRTTLSESSAVTTFHSGECSALGGGIGGTQSGSNADKSSPTSGNVLVIHGCTGAISGTSKDISFLSLLATIQTEVSSLSWAETMLI